MNSLAEVSSVLRGIHLFMEQSGRFSDITNTLIPSLSHSLIENSVRTVLNFSIDGELVGWVDKNKKAFGTSLVIGHFEGQWFLECEYGWSGQEVGWDPVSSSDFVYPTSRDLMVDVKAVAEKFRSSVLSFLAEKF
ncbi:hypothetical protein [Lysobacter capsici]|uniref:hypothetical protein n=1 Tax=Lysobacter capsici TaxID=435897 RepID=UPI00129077DC|nr:hypothetical protein [Lysobacter capsici]